MQRKRSALIRSLSASFLVFTGMATLAAGPSTPPFGIWRRLTTQPLISPEGNGFESAGTFNPAVLKLEKDFVMLYRAQDRSGTSRLGYATSRDGIRFARRREPVMAPETPYEKGGGVEAPRVVQVHGTFY